MRFECVMLCSRPRGLSKAREDVRASYVAVFTRSLQGGPWVLAWPLDAGVALGCWGGPWSWLLASVVVGTCSDFGAGSGDAPSACIT